jgi:AraC-like DNA-binding protein
MSGCKIQNPLCITKLHSFFYKKLEDNYFFRGESHDFYEVVCVLSGEVGITAGKQVFTLKKGEMTFHSPGEFHAIWEENATNPEVIIFSFSASAFPTVIGKIFHVNEDSLSSILELYNEAKKHLIFSPGIQIKEEHETDVALLVKRLEIFIISKLRTEGKFLKATTQKSTNVFSEILSAMEKHIKEQLTVNELANMCGISVATLEKTVYKYLGYGAMAHFNVLKLQKAHTLLLDGESVKNTSIMLGFSNQNYFSSKFKRYYGYPPSSIHSVNS